MSISFSGVLPAMSPAATNTPPKPSNLSSSSAQSVTQQFLAYANMTPAQRMQADMLSQLGITEAEYKAMSPAEQQKVDEKIQQMIKRQAEASNDKRSGLITDISV